MAIFVTEDDPQGGVDHVATTRTVSLMISPYMKRGYISHRHHSSMGRLKTMFSLLGAQPMSLFDRNATDLRDYFTEQPDFTKVQMTLAEWLLVTLRIGCDAAVHATRRPGALRPA